MILAKEAPLLFESMRVIPAFKKSGNKKSGAGLMALVGSKLMRERFGQTQATLSISREEVRRLLGSREITLIEVLPPEHYERAHLPGALNIPYEQIASLAPALLPEKKSALVVYGLNFTWQTAHQAVRELVAIGYTNVREYEEGKQDWVAAGLPLEGKNLDEPISRVRPSEFAGNVSPAQQNILRQQSSKADASGS